ncbi:MAG: glycosyltransferase family 9 protein [Planctomycetota bacterium]
MPRSILIVRLSALGDVIHVLPTLAALRAAFPGAKLGWAVEDRAASLLEGHPQLDRLHVVPRRRWTEALGAGRLAGLRTEMLQAVRALREERYEVALDFQSNFRSAALTRLSGAPRRIGQPSPYGKEGSRLFFSEVPPAVPRGVHKIERNLELLRPLDARPAETPRPVFAPRPAFALPPPGPLGRVALHPGVSAFGALKAWREERFAALGAALAARGAAVTFVWGGAREQALAERLAAQAPGTAAAPPTRDLHDLAALLEQVDLFVGVDSGPLHLAAALGAPVLGLYGPKHTGTYGPYWPGTEVLAAKLECSPCRYRRCPRPDAARVDTPDGPVRISPCMDSLEVEAAAAACLALLERRAARA